MDGEWKLLASIDILALGIHRISYACTPEQKMNVFCAIGRHTLNAAFFDT